MKIFKLKWILVSATFLALITPASIFAQKTPANLKNIAKIKAIKNVNYVKGEVLVKFKDRSLTITNATKGPLKNIGGKSVKRNERFRIHKVKLPKGMNVADAISFLAQDDAVEYVQPNYIYEALQTFPGDPMFDQQWALHNTGQTGGTPDADIDAPEAWDETTGSSDVVVAVIDTGVDYTHEDLESNMWTNPGETPGNGIDDDSNGYIDDIYGIDTANDNGNPMDDNGHGTHCAGIIGAMGGNTTGIAGVNWQVKIMALKFTDNGVGTSFDIIEAFSYVIDMKKNRGVNVKVTSNSYGGRAGDPCVYMAIQTAGDEDILVIAGAGNGGTNNDQVAFYPASFDLGNIISVAATDQNDDLATFSQYGPRSVDLAAPGVEILSTFPPFAFINLECNDDDGDGYGLCSGTSMATPYVAGVAALIYSMCPGYTFSKVKQTILSSVDQIPSLAGIVQTGGRLNAEIAVGPPPAFLPDIWLDSTAIDMAVAADSAGNYYLAIENRGSEPLIFNITNRAPWLDISPTQDTILAFGKLDLSVAVNGDGLQPGTYHSDIVIHSNDPDENTIVIPVNLFITEGWVDVSAILQGTLRPDPEGWEIPLTIQFFSPDADILNDTPLYEFRNTTTKTANMATCRMANIPGNYDITIDSEHILMNVVTDVIISELNTSLHMGTLLEGDCNNDHKIGLIDKDIIQSAYGTAEGDVGYDSRADLNRNGAIDDEDLNLHSANARTIGPIEIPRVDITVVLEGTARPDPEGWEVPISIGFFNPGANVSNDPPIYGFQQNTTKSGDFAICQATGVEPDTYDITVDSEHTLMNVKRSVVISGPNTSVYMGTLLEGDCNDDGLFTLNDFTIFKNAFVTYDARADFDRNGVIDLGDFNLFKKNFNSGASSPVEIP